MSINRAFFDIISERLYRHAAIPLSHLYNTIDDIARHAEAAGTCSPLSLLYSLERSVRITIKRAFNFDTSYDEMWDQFDGSLSPRLQTAFKNVRHLSILLAEEGDCSCTEEEDCGIFGVIRELKPIFTSLESCTISPERDCRHSAYLVLDPIRLADQHTIILEDTMSQWPELSFWRSGKDKAEEKVKSMRVLFRPTELDLRLLTTRYHQRFTYPCYSDYHNLRQYIVDLLKARVGRLELVLLDDILIRHKNPNPRGGGFGNNTPEPEIEIRKGKVTIERWDQITIKEEVAMEIEDIHQDEKTESPDVVFMTRGEYLRTGNARGDFGKRERRYYEELEALPLAQKLGNMLLGNWDLSE